MIDKIIIERLKKLGIPYNSNLPEISEINLRTAKEVSIRVNLMNIFIAIYDDSKSIKFFNNLIAEQGLYEYLSDSEKTILKRGKLLKQEEIDISWYQESLHSLCWCLGIIPNIEVPYKEVKLNSLFPSLPPEVDLHSFIDDSKLISERDIKIELDFYYHIHWALRHPSEWSFFNKIKLSKYNISIIRERRKALEWILNKNLDWDDLSLDT